MRKQVSGEVKRVPSAYRARKLAADEIKIKRQHLHRVIGTQTNQLIGSWYDEITGPDVRLLQQCGPDDCSASGGGITENS